MHNLKKITFGIFIVPLLLIFQSVSYAEQISESVTYNYKFAPLGAGIDWEKYIPGEGSPIGVHFKFLLSPPTFEGEMNAAIILDLDQSEPMLSVQSRINDNEPFVGRFESHGGVQIIGDIVIDFSIPIINKPINYRIPILGNLKALKNIPGTGPITDKFIEIAETLDKLKDKGWSTTEHCDSLLLEEDEFIQLEEVGIRNIFSVTDKDLTKEEESALDITVTDAAVLAAYAGATAATSTGGVPVVGAVAVDAVDDEVVEAIKKFVGDAGLKVNLGILTPLTFSGGGVYLDGRLATRERQPVESCGLDPDLGYYGLDPDSGTYALSTSYVGTLEMGVDLVISLDLFFKVSSFGITFWSGGTELAEQRIHITDKRFNLNFEPTDLVKFEVDADSIMEKYLRTEAERFTQEFQRSPQWHLTDGAKARLGAGSIAAIAYSPDGCQLAVAGWNGSISLYNSNVGSGEKREFLSANVGGSYGIQSLSFNRDSTILASGGADVMLWDVATGLIITTLPHGYDVQSVHFSPDGKTLASGGGESGVKLWDIATKTEIATLPHGNRRVRFSPDSKTLATAANHNWGGYGSVQLWNAATGTEITTLPLGEDARNVDVDFSPKGTILATTDNYRIGDDGGGRVRLWDVATGTEIATLLQDKAPNDQKRSGRVFSVAFSQDGDTLAAGGDNLYLWDVATRTEIAQLPIVDAPLVDITFSPDGTTLSGVTANSWRMRSWGVYRTPEKAILTEIATLGQARGDTKRVRFGPDSKTLVSFDNKGARLWDTDTGKEIRTLFHTEGESLTGDLGDFSPDGTTFALVFSTYYRHDHNPEIGNLELWDAETRTRKRTLGSPTLPVESVAFGKNGKRVAGGRGDGVVVWDVESGKEIATLPYDHRVHSVALSPNGKILAGNDANGTVKLWDVERGKEIATLSFKTEVRFGAASLSFDPDNKMLAVGGSPTSYASLSLWEAETGKHITTLDTLERSILVSVAFSPDGETIASSHRDGAVELWDVATETRKTTFWTNIRDGVESVHFSPDGKTLATAAEIGTVLLWDLTLIDTGTEIATLTSHGQWIADVDFSRDGKTLAAADEDGNVRLWNISDEPTLETTIEFHNPISVRFSPDGETLAISGGWLLLWNIATNTEIATPTGDTGGYIYNVAFSPPDGKTLASGSEDGKVRLWDVESRTLKATLTGHTDIVTDVAFSRDGKTLASGSADGKVRLWNIATETEIATLTEIPTLSTARTVWSVDFSPDGKTLASGSEDGKVRLWDVDSGTLKVRLQHNYAAVRTTARFSPDGKTLASSHGGNVVLWDVATGAVKAKLTVDTVTLHSICFSPDGKMLASGGAGHRGGAGRYIKLWDITSAVESTTAPPLLVADVNGDGVVDIDDLVAVNSALLTEASGNNADVNQDGVINIADLVLVAAAIATSEAAVAAAPAVIAAQAEKQLTPADVQRWLIQAHAAKLTDATAKRGILFLEYLLSVLTPEKTALLPNYPNPFNPETWIPYQLAEPADVSLTIYDIQGRVVRDLDLGHQRAGMYHNRARAAYWDGKNVVGESVASGVYFYTLTAGDFAATRKMLIRK